VLTLYRRHQAPCRHTARRFRNCKCPIWVQGSLQTADRVLIYIDTAHASEQLINSRLAYVAVSRARYDVQIYTNDKTQLTAHLQRDVSHRSAIEASQEQSQRQHSIGLGR
jgi:ATP-dependent exoDNAse (exonuclease V) alpha subunit